MPSSSRSRTPSGATAGAEAEADIATAGVEADRPRTSPQLMEAGPSTSTTNTASTDTSTSASTSLSASAANAAGYQQAYAAQVLARPTIKQPPPPEVHVPETLPEQLDMYHPGALHYHPLPPIQERSTLAVDKLLTTPECQPSPPGTPPGPPAPAPASPAATAPSASAIPPPSSSRPLPPSAPSAPNRRRAHSVGVRMPLRQQLLNKQQQQQPNFQPDVEAQHPAADAERRERRQGSQTSSRRERSSSISAVSITIPEAHDSDIADHSGALHDDVVGLLDCVDPEVGTVNHLQNVTNSIMFPNIPMLWTRRPHLTLNSHTDEYEVVPHLLHESDQEPETEPLAPKPRAPRKRASTLTRFIPGFKKEEEHQQPPQRPTVGRRTTAPADIPLTPVLTDDKKVQREVIEDVKEVTKEHELDKHVRRVLVNKDKVRRGLRGLWAYLKTPMGCITAIYGFLVAFWGAAIVLFLLGWIPTSSKDTQDKWVEISSQVTNGLFTITGVGLIPWRAVDTYRMSVIWTLRMRVVRRREALGLPPAKNNDDLPKEYDPDEELLSEKDHARLVHHQEKFAESQTWYRPHETATHLAFPIKWALWNTIFMDLNSFFQCILCGCMWGMNRHTRPPWTTGSLIPLSFLCGIAAAVLIWQGGVRTKKKDVEERLRVALGVEEKIPETVKKPRRATVTGVVSPAVSPAVTNKLLPPESKPSLEPLPAVPPVGTVSKTFQKDMLELVDEAPEHVVAEPEEIHDIRSFTPDLLGAKDEVKRSTESDRSGPKNSSGEIEVETEETTEEAVTEEATEDSSLVPHPR